MACAHGTASHLGVAQHGERGGMEVLPAMHSAQRDEIRLQVAPQLRDLCRGERGLLRDGAVVGGEPRRVDACRAQRLPVRRDF